MGGPLYGSAASLDQVVRALREGLGGRLVSVVLFGSRARGDEGEDSDWDLLVIAEGLPEGSMSRRKFIRGLLPPKWRHRVSVIAKTPEEFESSLPPLYLDIALDGIIIYDPRDYASKKLSYIRDRIEELGLRRRRLGKGWVWLWRSPPGTDWEIEWKR